MVIRHPKRLRRWLAGIFLDHSDRAKLHASNHSGKTDPAQDGNAHQQYRRHDFADAGLVAASVSASAKSVAADIRGDHPAAIFLHAVMPRSGSVHTGNLIRLHPDIQSYSNDIWEFPFLTSSENIADFQHQFFATYSQNDDKLDRDDFMALFGAAAMRYLLKDISRDKVLLMKDPRVDGLHRFPTAFPNERLMLLVRDGRDVVNSTVMSWPEFEFESICETWNTNAVNALKLLRQHSWPRERVELKPDTVKPSRPRIHSNERSDKFLLVRFEDVVANPERIIREICDAFDLDVSRYPFDQISGLPVQGSSEYQPEGSVDWQNRQAKPGFNPVARWRQWDLSQKDTFKKIAGQTLIDLGYERDFDW